VLPDNKLVNIALDDAFYLGVLSSRIHVTWVLAAGSTLEDRPVYVKTTCFETFPFPDASDAQRARIRDLAEQLDTHRKRQQATLIQVPVTGELSSLEVTGTLEPQPWPTALKDRATAARAALTAINGPTDLNTVTAAFAGKRTAKRLAEIKEILEMLVMLGQAVDAGNGRYAAG